jgi:hypothetical protein
MSFSKEIECGNEICSWSWDLEPDDDKPYLCHKCGYDSKLGDFDMKSLHQWEKENNYPFDEYVEEGYHIRTFKEDVNNSELVWHRDREDRIVFPLHETDWKIQFDNNIPQNIEPKNPILIESGRYHRIIKGNKDLKLKIYKTNLEDKSKINNVIYETLKILLEHENMLSEHKKKLKSERGVSKKKVPEKYLTKNKSAMKKEIDKYAGKDVYKSQWDADYKSGKGGLGKRYKTKESTSTKAYKKMYGESEELEENKKSSIDKTLANKAKASGISKTTLKQVHSRGMAAWNSGHRPGTPQSAWAMGRVNSFITGSGGARKADADLWAKAKKKKSKNKK